MDVATWSRKNADERVLPLAVRAAIGAARDRLVRQLLTETALYCAVGTGRRYGLSGFGPAERSPTSPRPHCRASTRCGRAGGRMFAIALGVSLLTMLLFGLLPALRAGRIGVQTVLQRAGRRGMSGGYRGARRASNGRGGAV